MIRYKPKTTELTGKELSEAKNCPKLPKKPKLAKRRAKRRQAVPLSLPEGKGQGRVSSDDPLDLPTGKAMRGQAVTTT